MAKHCPKTGIASTGNSEVVLEPEKFDIGELLSYRAERIVRRAVVHYYDPKTGIVDLLEGDKAIPCVLSLVSIQNDNGDGFAHVIFQLDG